MSLHVDDFIIEHKSKSDVYHIWSLGDFHLGNRACAEKMLRKTIKTIQDDPFALWIGMGDYAEFIGFTDKRFDPDSVAESVKVKDLKRLGKHLMGKVEKLLAPIADKCIGILCGNHEKKYEAHKEQADLTQDMAEKIGVPFHGYWVMKTLIFRYRPTVKCKTSNAFLIFAHHGSGFATTSGGKLNKLIQAWTICPVADFTMLAHVHEPMAHPNIFIRPGAGKTVDHHENMGVITGSYLKTYDEEIDTYGTQKLYKPVSLGAKMITIKPYHRLRNTIVGDMI